MLPVRWMPPESLVDGVFTSQSDVWAFGVLMWEITTLGQQPYPAMTNFEVLHHVSAGNRLPRPLNSPPALHQLMLRCWSVADARPSFKVCLDNIVALRSDTEDAVLSPVHAGHVARRGTNKRPSLSYLRTVHRMESLQRVFFIESFRDNVAASRFCDILAKAAEQDVAKKSKLYGLSLVCRISRD